jgi:hypothetical protein
MSCLVTYGKTMSYADLATIKVDNLLELSAAIQHLFIVEDT